MSKTGQKSDVKPSSTPDRAGETRARLLHSGLVLFGQQGFDATTTRALAEHANVNLAAIPYHFGGKEGLYNAVASHLVDEISARLLANPALKSVFSRPPETPQDARKLIHMVLDRLVDVLVGGHEAELWAPFVLREQMAPTAAFDILYRGLMEQMLIGITGCVALATGNRHSVQTNAIRSLTLFGQIIAFRTANSAVKRALHWSEIGEAELNAIKSILHLNIDAILDAGQTS